MHPTALDYWTLAIAILGAVTGLAALVTQVWGLVLAGPRVKVSLTWAFAPGGQGWLLSLEAMNVGRLPVTVVDAGVLFTVNGELQRSPLGLSAPGTSFGPERPHRLPDGESVTWVLEPLPLARTLVDLGTREVTGYVRLGTGQEVTSRRQVDAVALASRN